MLGRNHGIAAASRTSEEDVRAIIIDQFPQIVEEEHGAARILSVSVTPPFSVHHDRYHRIAKVRYDDGRRARELSIWLKFRPRLETAFENHCRAWKKLGTRRSIVPQPYFCCRCGDGDLCVVGMEHVPGTPLQQTILRAVATGRHKKLADIFFALGEGVRAFHEALALPLGRSVMALTDRLRAVIALSTHVTVAERSAIYANIEHAGDIVGCGVVLGLTHSHNDLKIRNIVVKPNCVPTVVDCDALGSPDETSWHDVAYCLINIESIIRYSPLLNSDLVTRLSTAFLSGYRGYAYPDALSNDQMRGVLYLVRVELIIGAGHRPPLLGAYYRTLVGRGFARQLKGELIGGMRLS